MLKFRPKSDFIIYVLYHVSCVIDSHNIRVNSFPTHFFSYIVCNPIISLNEEEIALGFVTEQIPFLVDYTVPGCACKMNFIFSRSY